jgi:putative transposase
VFDTVFEAEGITVKKVGPRAPNMNAYAERWVQSVRRECLDHFIVLGRPNLRRRPPAPSAASASADC